MSLWRCVYIYIFTYTYIYIYIYTYTFIYIHTYICTCTYMYIYMYIHIYIYIYISIYVYTYICIYTHTCTHIDIFILTCAHMYHVCGLYFGPKKRFIKSENFCKDHSAKSWNKNYQICFHKSFPAWLLFLKHNSWVWFNILFEKGILCLEK